MYVIHRRQDTEREHLVTELQAVFPRLTVFEGIDGSTVSIGRVHPWEGIASDGVLGNTASHVTLIRQALEVGLETLTLFEDDAVVEGECTLAKPAEWDIWFWGVNEVVKGNPEGSWIRVVRAWGSHALCLNRKAMLAAIAIYEQSVRDGIGLPSDWMYNYAIHHYGLKAYCPPVNVISQKKGLVSLLTGNIR